jgi:hypothetical protein
MTMADGQPTALLIVPAHGSTGVSYSSLIPVSKPTERHECTLTSLPILSLMRNGRCAIVIEE